MKEHKARNKRKTHKKQRHAGTWVRKAGRARRHVRNVIYHTPLS